MSSATPRTAPSASRYSTITRPSSSGAVFARGISRCVTAGTTAADQPAYATTPGAEAPAFTAAIESRAPPTAGSTAASQLRLVRLGVRPQLAAGKRRLNRQREVCDESSDGGSRCETMWIDVRSALAYLEIARGWSIGSSSGFSGGAEAGCRNCTVSCFAPAGRTGASPPPLRR